MCLSGPSLYSNDKTPCKPRNIFSCRQPLKKLWTAKCNVLIKICIEFLPFWGLFSSSFETSMKKTTSPKSTCEQGRNFSHGLCAASFAPQKNECPAATVALVPHPHLPSGILFLFCKFLLCLASVIMVFRRWCLLGIWLVIDQQCWNSEGWAQFLPWYELLKIATIKLVTQINRHLTTWLNWAHSDIAKLETREEIWEETTDWTTEVKTVTHLTELQPNLNVCDVTLMLEMVTLTHAC